MFGPVKCAGVWSLGLVHIATASYPSFGLEASLFGIFFSLIANLICAQCGITKRGRSCSLGSWMEQLGLLCWVSAGCSALSSFLDYYDDLQHHSYLHLVPIDVFPRVMPLVIVFVVSALFALGLEESHLLNVISTILFWATFGLFTASSSINYKNNFADLSLSAETVSKSVLGAAVWFPFIVGSRDGGKLKESKDVLLSCATYVTALLMLSSLDVLRAKDGRAPSLMEPLGAEYSWYLLLQVPLASCCLGMAVYQLYLPALENVAHKSFVVRLSRDSRVTGTKLAAVTVVGIYCWSLIYLYSSGRLVLIGAASTLLARSADSLHALWIQRRPSPASLDRFNKGMKRKKDGYLYKTVKSSEDDDIESGLLSSDSGHSIDTDIDEIVEEYKINSEVMRGVELKKPTKRTGMISSVTLLFATALSLLISRELSNSQLAPIPWFMLGLLVTLLILYMQPTRPEENNFVVTTIIHFLTIVITTILFGVVVLGVWIPVLFWAILGAVLYFHIDIRTAVAMIHPNGGEESLKPSLSHLPPPKIEIRLQAIQLRSKPAYLVFIKTFNTLMNSSLVSYVIPIFFMFSKHWKEEYNISMKQATANT